MLGWPAVNQPAPAPTGSPKPPGRIDAIDWLRGLAVVLMIETHLFGHWTSPAARATWLYQETRWPGGLPFRMFLLLAGVSMAIKFESQIARGVERREMVRGAFKRGFEVLVLAYLFRLQEYVLSFFWDWHDRFCWRRRSRRRAAGGHNTRSRCWRRPSSWRWGRSSARATTCRTGCPGTSRLTSAATTRRRRFR
jgi:hypothetical protein